jgi:hypothetical protein
MVKNFDQLLQQQQQQPPPPPADPALQQPPTPKSPVSRPWYDKPTMLLSCNQRDPRNFRPFGVKLSLAIHNINGHLALDLTEGVGAVPLPIGFTDRIALELVKTYTETKLQVYVSPLNVFVEDLVPREYDRKLAQGHLCLASVQVRGHAMFSDCGRTPTDTLEYAWLLEVILGDATGHLTAIQAETLLHGLEALCTTAIEADYQLHPVYCNRVDPALPFKYEVTRFSLDLVDVYLVESGTALNVNLSPVRLSHCNSHSNDYASCLSAIIGDIRVKLFVNEASRMDIESSTRRTSTTANHADSSRKNTPSRTATPQRKLRAASTAKNQATKQQRTSIADLSKSSLSINSANSLSISSLNSSLYSTSRKSLAGSQNTLIEKSSIHRDSPGKL